MSIKKKIGVGVLTGVLGLSLVGGGTWAAFNDIEVVDNNRFAAGVLDLEVHPEVVFDVSNLKPTERMDRTFTIKHGQASTIDFAKVLMNTEVTNFSDGERDLEMYGPTNADEFAKQFEVQIWWTNQYQEGEVNLLNRAGSNPEGGRWTLYDLINNDVFEDFDISRDGLLSPDQEDKIRISLIFENKDERLDNGLMKQNRFQGDELEFKFTFEAVQDMHGPSSPDGSRQND
ncbi:TasA family protein [Alteribacter aurantiacus]|uniref:TasA family protein n=1 Tax=Alteribacter aurantiacus TaxID=254410 RepID=UPI0004271141|nr:TasA family protein [Alteribacter aurantiacus]